MSAAFAPVLKLALNPMSLEACAQETDDNESRLERPLLASRFYKSHEKFDRKGEI